MRETDWRVTKTVFVWKKRGWEEGQRERKREIRCRWKEAPCCYGPVHTPPANNGKTSLLCAACFTQSGSIAMNHTAHCDTFGLILEVWNNVDVLYLCIFGVQTWNKLLWLQQKKRAIIKKDLQGHLDIIVSLPLFATPAVALRGAEYTHTHKHWPRPSVQQPSNNGEWQPLHNILLNTYCRTP